MSKDDLGDRMKFYEMAEAGRKLNPLQPIMVRIDGRRFSKFTEGLDKPFDRRIVGLMDLVTTRLIKSFNAVLGYTQSDEITLCLYKEPESKEPSVIFGGRPQKLTSIIAAETTLYFNKHLPNFLPANYVDKNPMFDCRVWNVPTTGEAANCFIWRQLDCMKNAVSATARKYLGHSVMQNKNSLELKKLLEERGCYFDEYPDFFKNGLYLCKHLVAQYISELDLKSLPEKHEARKGGPFNIESFMVDYLVMENNMSDIYGKLKNVIEKGYY